MNTAAEVVARLIVAEMPHHAVVLLPGSPGDSVTIFNGDYRASIVACLNGYVYTLGQNDGTICSTGIEPTFLKAWQTAAGILHTIVLETQTLFDKQKAS
jgi:hypothetical protein